MAHPSLGLVQVYTGEGKGKTTASMGLAMRAIGQGFKVYIVQFLKGGSYTGEFVTACEYLPSEKIMFIQCGKGCLKSHKQLKIDTLSKTDPEFITVRDEEKCGSCRYCFTVDDSEEKNIERSFDHAREIAKSGEWDILIMDEINCVAASGLISPEKVVSLMKEKHPNCELILTGRNAPELIKESADLVSYVKEIKHYYNTKGILARRGIEY
jgi:cob(I)alamin adenosyltransferase